MKLFIELLGPAGIAAAVVLFIGFIDIITGGILFIQMVNLMDCTNYPNLIAKYRDENRIKYADARNYAYTYYKEYIQEAWHERDFTQLLALKRARKAWDYIQLYNLMLDWDGDIENQIIQ